MRAAPQLDVRDGRVAAGGIRLHVVELEKRGLAAASLATHERAAAFITSPDLAAHRGGYVARTCVFGLGPCRHPWAGGLGEAPAFEFLDEQRDRAVEDLSSVAGRDGMAKERLRPAKLVVRFTRDGQLNSVTLGCKRRDAGGCRWWR